MFDTIAASPKICLFRMQSRLTKLVGRVYTSTIETCADPVLALTSARVPVATAPTLVRLADALPTAILRPRVGARPIPGLDPARRLTLAPLRPVRQAAVNWRQVAHTCTCTDAVEESDGQLDWIRHPCAPWVAVDDYVNTRQQKVYPG